MRPDGQAAVECAVSSIAISSIEDTILRKLEWYRLGGGTFERQWGDLRGMCGNAGTALGVADLLEALLGEYNL